MTTLGNRVCARTGCTSSFEVTSKHPKKIYCTPRCRTLANVAKARTSSEVDELEIDVDHVDDLELLLAERGLKLDDWVVLRVTVNKWEGFIKNDAGEAERVPLRQLKVYLRRKVDLGNLIQPCSLPAAPYVSRSPKKKSAAKLFFIYGDDQWPHADEKFKELQLQWVSDTGPDEIIDLGDGCDMPTISTHKVDPSQNWTVQECADTYATWLYKLRCAAVPGTRIRVLADNHMTARLRDYQTARAASLYGIKPADIDGLEEDLEPLWSVRRLLRLDDLHVEYIDPPGDTHYAESFVEIIPNELVAIHGYRTGSNLGKKFIDDHGCSVIYGHQHGQDLYVTDYRRRGVGTRRRRYAIGVGCGSKIGSVNYAPGADHQNCALTVSVFPDGGWSFDYMNYEDGILRWRDKMYS